ncbi:MAG TPA: hypothetical protein VJB59_13130 [Bdellovibrionota bacterium]|nr:hypothetical protein [Bdellovibrionota bacterium]
MLEEFRFRIIGTMVIVIGGINMVAAGMRYNGSANYRNPAWVWIQPYLQLQDFVLRMLFYAAVLAAICGTAWFILWLVGAVRNAFENARREMVRQEYEVQRQVEREAESAREVIRRMCEAEDSRRAQRERERAEAVQRAARIRAEEVAKSDPEIVRKRAIEQITKGF